MLIVQGEKAKRIFTTMSMSLYKKFTLIELLTVIAIIAVLAAILLPSLNRAKEQAHLVKCLGNLRQTGFSIVNYASDNQNYRPPIYNSTPTTYWAKILVEGGYVQDKTNFSILQCPYANPLTLDTSYNKTYGMMRESPYRGLDEVPLTTLPYRMDSSKIPSEDILLADSIRVAPAPVNIQVFTVYKNYNSSGTFSIHTRHSGKANMFFYDGHAGGFTFPQIRNLKSFNIQNPSAIGSGTDYAIVNKNFQIIRWTPPVQ